MMGFSLLRSVILSLACSMGDEDCLSTVQKKFKEWIDAKTSGTLVEDINPNIKSVVYFYGKLSILFIYYFICYYRSLISFKI